MSPYKVRVVLDLIRQQDGQRATDILRFCERDAAIIIGKLLSSAVANAEHNDGLDGDELFVSACYADEGVTLKRFRPRPVAASVTSASGRAHHGHRQSPSRGQARPVCGPSARPMPPTVVPVAWPGAVKVAAAEPPAATNRRRPTSNAVAERGG